MIGYVLVSHGDYAKSMKEAVEMIVGSRENIHSIGLQPHESGENFIEKIIELEGQLKNYSGYIFFCDLLGGTPCNSVIKQYFNNQDVNVVSGMNFSMVLTAIVEETINVTNIIEAGRSGIIDVKDFCLGDDCDY